MHDEVQYLLMTYHRDELPAVRTTEQHEKSREPIEFLSFHFFFIRTLIMFLKMQSL